MAVSAASSSFVEKLGVLFFGICFYCGLFYYEQIVAPPKRGSSSIHFWAGEGNLRRVGDAFRKDQLELRDERGRTPLAVAVLSKKIPMVLFLLEQGADKNAIDDDGNTPFLLAVDQKCGEIAVILATRGADFLRGNHSNYSPLHAAARRGNLPMVFFLLENGAPVNGQETNAQWTPLHFASSGGFPGIVRLLLKYGANPSLRLTYGWTPRDLAEGNKQIRVQNVFDDFQNHRIPVEVKPAQAEINFSMLTTPEYPFPEE